MRSMLYVHSDECVPKYSAAQKSNVKPNAIQMSFYMQPRSCGGSACNAPMTLIHG